MQDLHGQRRLCNRLRACCRDAWRRDGHWERHRSEQ